LRTLRILLEPLRPVLRAFGIHLEVPNAAASSLVWSIRLPRVLLALVVGAGLGAAGLVMQATFRNPLADPGITGVSSGAAVVAVLLIITGAASPVTLPLGAFLGALGTVLVVQLVAGLRGGGGATLLLVGVALNSLLGAIISAAIANAPASTDAQQAMFWLNGDLTGSGWGDLGIAAPPILLGLVVLLLCPGELNLFLLGEEQAAATGMRTVLTRQVLLAVAAVVTAAGVAVTGVIGFVGLVIPHLARLVLGPDHRVLMPVSVLVGGIFLVLADVVARNLLQPVVLQTGTVTAFLGAPVLLALIIRRQNR
jgi:iron complex transport system permease protein